MWSGEERAARELCVKSVVVAGLGRAERSSPREEELGIGAGRTGCIADPEQIICVSNKQRAWANRACTSLRREQVPGGRTTLECTVKVRSKPAAPYRMRLHAQSSQQDNATEIC